MTLQINLTEEFEGIFRESASSFDKVAHFFRIPNSTQVKEEWKSTAYEIITKFEKGSLTLRVYERASNGKYRKEDLVVYDPEKHNIGLVRSTLAFYLKRSFQTHCLKLRKNLFRTKELKTDLICSKQINELKSSLLKNDIFNIGILAEFLERDIRGLELDGVSLTKEVKILFLKSLLNLTATIFRKGSEWENLVVIDNLEEGKKYKVLSYDFKIELKEKLRRELNLLALQEKRPNVLRALVPLLNKLSTANSKTPLEHRVDWYMFSYKGGLIKRFKFKRRSKFGV